MSARIGVRGVTVAYTAPDGSALPALGPVTFTIEAGQFVCLVGPSGCGKSTLIRVLAGLIAPTRGEATLDDEPIRAAVAAGGADVSGRQSDALAHGARQHRPAARTGGRGQAGTPRGGAAACCRASACPNSRWRIPASFPAGWRSASRWGAC